MTAAVINRPAPPLSVSAWVQGGACNFADLIGNVVLVEVFQVNCPGCFLYALPQALDFYQRYSGQGLVVLGLATAFEDFDKNTLSNLQLLAETCQVIGETLQALNQQKILNAGRLPYRIPFPLAMDQLSERQQAVTDDEVYDFIKQRLPDVGQQPEPYRQQIIQQVHQYLESLTYRAETFANFNLQGTPSHILVDRQGILRDCAFGFHPNLENRILDLLNR